MEVAEQRSIGLNAPSIGMITECDTARVFLNLEVRSLQVALQALVHDTSIQASQRKSSNTSPCCSICADIACYGLARI